MKDKQKLRSTVLALAVVLLLGFLFPTSASATAEGPGFQSPEDALMAYIEGLQQGDLAQMISTFAIETYVEHFDLAAHIERRNQYDVTMRMIFSNRRRLPVNLPNANPLIKELNIESRRSDIVIGILDLLMGFQFTDQFDLYVSIAPFPNEDFGDVVDFVDMLRENMESMALQSTVFETFMELEELDEFFATENSQLYYDRICRTSGADEAKDTAVLLMIGAEPYVLCATAIRYGERWYLESLGGVFASFENSIVPLSEIFDETR
ncbi:MAG: hypothetical protein FWD25_08215 [Clostridia bacterium]|nr:hypothetical protein [Clostridia bacterium]